MMKLILSGVAVICLRRSSDVRDESMVVLSQRHNCQAFNGYWQLGGGRIEKDETPLKAAHRELKEELGLRIDIRRLQPMGPSLLFRWSWPFFYVTHFFRLNLHEDEHVRWMEPKKNTRWSAVHLRDAIQLKLMPGMRKHLITTLKEDRQHRRTYSSVKYAL